MLYIDYIGNNTYRFSNKSGGGGYDRFLPYTAYAESDEINRVWIRDSKTEVGYLNCYDIGDITFDGATFTDAEDFVDAFNGFTFIPEPVDLDGDGILFEKTDTDGDSIIFDEGFE